jgi:hypothetical protein
VKGDRKTVTMSGTSSRSPAEWDLQLENGLLMEIVMQHPDHLTQGELVTRMEGWPTGTDRIAILDSLQELKRSGLIRINGEVVEPTFAALRAAVIFEMA